MTDNIPKNSVQKRFGAYVQRLRSERIFWEKDRKKDWTQEYLVDISGLSIKIIRKIEAGEQVDLAPHVPILAKAFGLRGIALKEFWAMAGYPYPLDTEYDENQIRRLLSKIPYPASVRTPLWDIIAINSYHYILFGYETLLQKLQEGRLGANLLRMLFDPEVQGYGMPVRRHQEPNEDIETGRARGVRVFHSMSAPYIGEKRYQIIVEEMMKFREFENLWNAVSTYDDATKLLDYLPFREVFHPQFGKMEFISSHLHRRYLSDNLHVGVYTPMPSSFAQYQKLSEQITENEVYFFQPPNYK